MLTKSLSFLLCAGTLCAQTWRLSTEAEQSTKSHEQLVEMGKAGFIGDPQCSNGFAWATPQSLYSEEPCALTDGQGNFRSLLRIEQPGHKCLIPEDEAQTLRESGINSQQLVELCGMGALPSGDFSSNF